ncbi:ImuA family protein [Polymorphobacter fuscus]|uniref:Protein ImuA n=1 Tax=Sandarakinorhabdus fusca TaxID=1439888 RepID=A0A7C9GSL6_9SPHN|nr:hypothetical protein [Polymorphobacter fuscus]KAB7645533.1 hypothetical protein F9290_11950 [Polymorphobacter fuscus]MQT17971.1 hypothetical protein [Polymorphobacter fuscus]NJC08601.1 protein ImuA [Polymorphobacter fuscus]
MPRPALPPAVLKALLPAVGSAAAAQPAVTIGSANVDARLGGGLARAALHEVFAADADDASAAAGFTLMLALRAGVGKPVIWIREDRGERWQGRLHAPGLVELGADPGTILLVTGVDALAVLRAGADSVGCGALGAVVIEPWAKAPLLDLTASRRLALAAARSGVLTLVLRAGADPGPSAAATRWRVGAAPSPPLPAMAPGRPAFDISLLRHRSGIAGFDARVEWDRDRRSFCDPVLSGRLPADVAGRTAADLGRRAA